MTKKGPILYILCGLPFSGKTTLAKALAVHTGATVVGFDTTWAEMSEKLDSQMDKGDVWRAVRKVAFKKIRDSLKEKISVVYDEINVRYEHREELRSIASECGALSVIVYLNIPLDILLKREKVNKHSQERHEVRTENFEEALDQFEKPLSKEHVIVFDGLTDVDRWLADLSVRLEL